MELLKQRGRKLEIKSGSLEFILDEKDTLFNNFQKLIEQNKLLKEKSKAQVQEKNKKQDKKGWLSSKWLSGVSNYFKNKDLETIDSSKGKVRKNVKSNGQPLNIDDQLKNSSSYFSSRTVEDVEELKRKRKLLKKSKEENSNEKVIEENKEKVETKLNKLFIEEESIIFNLNRTK